MKVKSLIAEGSMCPKLNCEYEFVNPITKETQMCDMTVCVTREAIEQMSKEDIANNPSAALEEFAKKESEDANARFQYETIKEYAKEHNFIEISDEFKDTIWNHIQEITDSAESPKIIMDVRLLNELRSSIDARKADSQTPEYTSGSIYPYCTVTINNKSVRLFVHSVATWHQQNCLVYDETNPKNSKLISCK